MNPKFYIDECVAPKTATELRTKGFDAVWAGHVSHRGWDDPDHLVYAFENGYTVITENKNDFQMLHRLWTLLLQKNYIGVSHLGILTATTQLRPLSWITFIHQLISAKEILTCAFFVWDDATQGWQRF
jgi:predicted nuclease of predicted toxin-antitoxin system